MPLKHFSWITGFMNSKAQKQNLNYYKQREKEAQRLRKDSEAGGKTVIKER